MAVALIASLLTGVTSCGDPLEQGGPEGTEEFPVDRLAPCDPDRDLGEPFDPRYTMQRVNWVEVVGEDVKNMTIGDGPTERTVALTLTTAEVGVSLERKVLSVQTLLVNRDFLSVIEWITGTKARLFLGVEPVDSLYAGAKYEGMPLVWFAMVRGVSGSHRFAGRCAQVTIEPPLRETIGARYEIVLDELLIGGSEIAESVLFLDELAPPEPVEMLDSQLTYDNLNLINIALSWPKEWAESGWTICTKIARGWNDSCASLAMAGSEAEVSGFVEAGLSLEVWILDGGGEISSPIGLVGFTKPIGPETVADGSMSISVSGLLSVDARTITESVVDG
jgi:hypothetical protein